MIRIRYPNEFMPATHDYGPHVSVTQDPRVLADETEKNGPEIANEVDAVLRPLFATRWAADVPLFEIISIETRAGCNQTCSFCPVARGVDPRPPGVMSIELLNSIADQLRTLNYDGRISLFGNNEPLLDPRLTSIISLFRHRVPRSDIRILTNGTSLRTPQVRSFFEAGLSTLIINNYTDGRRIIGPVRALLNDARSFVAADIRINVRNRNAVLTTRAGTAPNKRHVSTPTYGFCALPFTDIHVSYTGTVNVCCFDAYGVTNMGDVATTSLADIWHGKQFAAYRSKLLGSTRHALTPCQVCDFDGFRDPDAGHRGSLIRRDLRSMQSSPS